MQAVPTQGYSGRPFTPPFPCSARVTMLPMVRPRSPPRSEGQRFVKTVVQLLPFPGGNQFLYGLACYGGFGSIQQKADIGPGRLQKLPFFNGIHQGFVQCIHAGGIVHHAPLFDNSSFHHGLRKKRHIHPGAGAENAFLPVPFLFKGTGGHTAPGTTGMRHKALHGNRPRRCARSQTPECASPRGWN